MVASSHIFFLPIDTQFGLVKFLLCEILGDPEISPAKMRLFPRLTLAETINLQVLQMETKRQFISNENTPNTEVCKTGVVGMDKVNLDNSTFPSLFFLTVMTIDFFPSQIQLSTEQIEAPIIDELEDTFTVTDYGFNIIDSILVRIINQ